MQIEIVESASANGIETPIEPGVMIRVADGLTLSLAFTAPGPAHIVAQLRLHGESVSRDGRSRVSSRFVIIPLDASSVLAGIAQASSTPADLMPTAAAPVWTNAEGAPMPSDQGSLIARTEGGTSLMLSLASGPGALDDACILQIVTVQRGGRSGDAARPALSIPVIAADAVQFAV